MEMVAAAKMRKAVQAATNTRQYAILAQELMKNLAEELSESHPFTIQRPNKNYLLVLISSNRGLCGNFNHAVLNNTDAFVKRILEDQKTNSTPVDIEQIIDEDEPAEYEIDKKSQKSSIDIIALGQKSANYAKKKNLGLIAFYNKLNENPTFTSITPISRTVIDSFLDNKYDSIYISYTNYISGLDQEPKIRKLLPISNESVQEMIQEAGEDTQPIEIQVERFGNDEYLFEPNKADVLDFVLPRLVEIQIFQAILESTASEHSSRMMAMKTASDSAQEMIDDLTLEFNKGRQAKITQEIAEIVNASDAQEQ